MNISRNQIFDPRLDRNLRIKGRDSPLRGNCLGQRFRCIFFREQRLPLQIARFHIIAIDNPQRSYPRPRE